MKPVADVKMFTFRLNSYQFVQYLLIFCVSSEVIGGPAHKKCAAFNEYCLNHWDCCSNSCMSYLYRCARGHGHDIYPYPFLGVSYKPTITLEQILEQNFGSSNTASAYEPKPYFISRDGGADDVATTVINIALQKPEATSSEGTIVKNPFALEEASPVYDNHLEKTSLKNSVLLKEIPTTGTKDQLSEELTEIYKDNASQATQATVKRSTEKPPCTEIGQKCYRSEECCSNLCHGYLHQCVT